MPHEEALLALDPLSARHLVIFNRQGADYKCLHRVIADLVFGKQKDNGELNEVLAGLGVGTGNHERNDRSPQPDWSIPRSQINHESLMNTIGFMTARDLYTRFGSNSRRVLPVLAATWVTGSRKRRHP